MQKKEIDDLNDTIKWFKTVRRNNDMACILPDYPMMKNIMIVKANQDLIGVH